MKNKVIKILLLVIPVIYLCLIYKTMYNWSIDSFSHSFWISFALTVLFGIINIILAIILTVKKEKQLLLTCGSLIKGTTVLAYILVFIYAFAGTAILTIFIGLLSSLIGLIFFILDAMMLIVSSSYMIGYLILDYKENKNKINIVHGIFQFIFVLDIVDSFVLIFTKEKKNKIVYLLLMILTILIPVIILKLFIL